MVIRRTVALLLAAIVAVWWGVAPADAEWNLDLYGGAAWIRTPTSRFAVRTTRARRSTRPSSISIPTRGLPSEPG